MDQLSRLAEAARGGDKRSLERFIEAAYEPVWELCAIVVDRQSADDLAQEAFLRALGALGSFRGDSSARAWILSIARHTCMDELRGRTRRRRRDATASVVAARTQEKPDEAESIAIKDLIAGLETDRRLAFVLTQVVGLSYKEAASVCSCPIGTIRSRVARARADLVSWLSVGIERAEDRSEDPCADADDLDRSAGAESPI